VTKNAPRGPALRRLGTADPVYRRHADRTAKANPTGPVDLDATTAAAVVPDMQAVLALPGGYNRQRRDGDRTEQLRICRNFRKRSHALPPDFAVSHYRPCDVSVVNIAQGFDCGGQRVVTQHYV
jgi:hypothetical protein